MTPARLEGGRRLPRRAPRPRLGHTALLVIAVVAVLAVGGWWFLRDPGITVQVNGQEVSASKGSTVEDILPADAAQSLTGDLVAIDGSVLEKGKGGAPVIRSGETTVALDTVLAGGETLAVERGANTTEPAKRQVREKEAPVEIEGSGPLFVVEQPGSPLRVVTMTGELSGLTMKNHVESLQIPTVFRRQTADSEQIVALTFDDGPNPAYTPKVLDILAEHDAKATFFVLGAAVARYPELAARAAREGHQLANHSYYHLNWDQVSRKQISEDIRWTQDAVKKAADTEISYLRPPGGRINDTVYKETQALDTKIVMWTADTHDWRRPAPDRISYLALSGLAPGAVVLMHDGGGDRSNTVAALPSILDGIKKRGYRMVTIDELWKAAERANES